MLELCSPEILLRKSNLALCVVPYGYEHVARTAHWSMCVSWSCLVRVKNQSKKLILNKAFIYRTTYLTSQESQTLFHVHIFADALHQVWWRLERGKMGCGSPRQWGDGNVPTNTERQQPWKKNRLAIYWCLYFLFESEQREGESVAGNLTPVSFTNFCTLTCSKQEGKSVCLKYQILC